MNIKSTTGLVLSVCTVTGIALGVMLVRGYQRVEAQLNELGPNSVTIKDVQRVKSLTGDWLLATDDVFINDKLYAVETTDRQAKQLAELLEEIRSAPLVAESSGDLTRIEGEIRDIQVWIHRADELRGDDRSQKLNALSAESNTHALRLTEGVKRLIERVERRSSYLAADLEDRRRVLSMLSYVAAGFYLGVVWLSWLWTNHKIVVPIEHLSNAAERAESRDAAFVLEEEGPEEVKRLTRNISAFVGKLQSAKERTEQEVRQRTAELVKANRAKAEFLATMSHELRTPLNGIINMNELILDTRLDQEQAGFAKTAKNAAEALLALINDILDFSKIEAKKLKLEQVQLDLRELVDSALEILGGVAEAKGLELHAVVDHVVPNTIIGDSTRLRQVMINLLNNALKFTASGSVSVRVRLVERSEIDAQLMVRVTDTGIGIPKERMNALFKVFEQVDSSTTRKYGGTGLGLAICKELATLMGGSIGVESELGKGSTFWFTARVGLVVTGQAPQELAGVDDVVLVSGRPLTNERLVEQLCYLGQPMGAIRPVLPSLPLVEEAAHGSGRRFAIVDPYGCDPALAREIVRVLAERMGPGRVAMLEHWLRKWPAKLQPLPVECVRLVQPAKTAALLEWLGVRNAGPAKGGQGARAAAVEQRWRILVAEDAAVNQRVVQSVLERAGFEPVVAEDGLVAVEAFTRESFDLVLMDCQMPRMDGIEATRRIRTIEAERTRLDGQSRKIPIVALTANAFEGVRERCLEAGMNDFMAKPYRPSSLVELVQRLLCVPGPEAQQTSPETAPEPAASEAAPPASAEPVATDPAPAEQPAAKTPKARILVADDSSINQRVALAVLGSAGYEVAVVENGQQALDHLGAGAVDLVLMDCQMPIVDGFEATRRIRKLEREGQLAPGTGRRLPIIALTGNVQDSDRQECMVAGMDAFLAKPFKPKELLAVVAEWLPGAELPKAEPAEAPKTESMS